MDTKVRIRRLVQILICGSVGAALEQLLHKLWFLWALVYRLPYPCQLLVEYFIHSVPIVALCLLLRAAAHALGHRWHRLEAGSVSSSIASVGRMFVVAVPLSWLGGFAAYITDVVVLSALCHILQHDFKAGWEFFSPHDAYGFGAGMVCGYLFWRQPKQIMAWISESPQAAAPTGMSLKNALLISGSIGAIFGMLLAAPLLDGLQVLFGPDSRKFALLAFTWLNVVSAAIVALLLFLRLMADVVGYKWEHVSSGSMLTNLARLAVLLGVGIPFAFAGGLVVSGLGISVVSLALLLIGSFPRLNVPSLLVSGFFCLFLTLYGAGCGAYLCYLFWTRPEK